MNKFIFILCILFLLVNSIQAEHEDKSISVQKAFTQITYDGSIKKIILFNEKSKISLEFKNITQKLYKIITFEIQGSLPVLEGTMYNKLNVIPKDAIDVYISDKKNYSVSGSICTKKTFQEILKNISKKQNGKVNIILFLNKNTASNILHAFIQELIKAKITEINVDIPVESQE
jgi:hypothetical protein